MSFSKVGTGRDQNSLHAAEFACELGGKLGGMVAITRAPLARTMSGNIVREPAGRADVPLNHEGAPASRRSKRTMSQIRRVCPPDSELRRRIRKVLLSDPDHRMSDAVTMATRARCMKKLEEECGCSLKHKAGFIHKELERISLGPSGGTKSRGAVKRPAPSAAEDSLMSELKSQLEGGNKKTKTEEAPTESQTEEADQVAEDQEQQQEEDVDMAEEVPLARTTSGLEQQLQAALTEAEDVLQHTDEMFDQEIPADVEQQALPDLISPDPRPDEEAEAAMTEMMDDHDASYVTASGEETPAAPQEAAVQVSPPLSASEKLSALREKLRQIQSPPAEAETEVTAPDAAAAPAETEAAEVEAEATAAEEECGLSYRTELEEKSRKELQGMAKANGIKANLSSAKIIDALCEQQQQQ